jgi:hypothetical protein
VGTPASQFGKRNNKDYNSTAAHRHEADACTPYEKVILARRDDDISMKIDGYTRARDGRDNV